MAKYIITSLASTPAKYVFEKRHCSQIPGCFLNDHRRCYFTQHDHKHLVTFWEKPSILKSPLCFNTLQLSVTHVITLPLWYHGTPGYNLRTLDEVYWSQHDRLFAGETDATRTIWGTPMGKNDCEGEVYMTDVFLFSKCLIPGAISHSFLLFLCS